MKTETVLKNQIKKSIESLSKDKLRDVKRFLDSIEKEQKSNNILSFAGSWSDLNELVFDEFTSNLEKRRENSGIRPRI